VVTPVPEPATWIMMIAGIGLIGLQLRRRRTVGAVAAA
ncbi:MAG: PEP-CTERM sorting domain-containing protein, partial [Sphingomonadaceae bacterium]|nr:PEP-CTERM sorting domain-containing protein [Sphingomonadaceae bacterium]